jgi:hypothetical protein
MIVHSLELLEFLLDEIRCILDNPTVKLLVFVLSTLTAGLESLYFLYFFDQIIIFVCMSL